MGRGGAGAFFLFFPNADSKSNDDNRFNSFSSMKTFKYDFPCISVWFIRKTIYENKISGGKNSWTRNSRIVEILNPNAMKLIWQFCCFWNTDAYGDEFIRFFC